MCICCPVAILILCEASLAMGERVSAKEARQLWVVGVMDPPGGLQGPSKPEMGVRVQFKGNPSNGLGSRTAAGGLMLLSICFRVINGCG